MYLFLFFGIVNVSNDGGAERVVVVVVQHLMVVVERYKKNYIAFPIFGFNKVLLSKSQHKSWRRGN
ncbi:hypothetical protein QJS04_geneDACA011011 [Acorus gramineus]|uniref:Uncharacterized protein n=1 Tax=Acorus gramineus TaxID=55184 RepID=A0AAV9BI03_ACOGR|nr:hypothetical protein QJS04_geneDACA011011 [Acorus gramineus]